MKPRRLVYILIPLLALPALASDQQKAQKELVKVTAMARDFTGRTVVNLSMSQIFNVPQNALVQERIETGMNYGSLLLAHELIKSGANMQDIAAQLKAGKNIAEVANDRHADWKAIGEDGKKFNKLVDNNLYRYFIVEKKQSLQPATLKTAPVPAVQYDVHHDGVKADADDVTDKDIREAGDRFRAMKDSAAKAKGDNKTLTLEQERIGYADHTQGPIQSGSGAGGTGNTSTGTVVPGFGGPPN